MTLTALRHDALTSVPGGFELRLGLPWIRSMPLSSIGALELRVDDAPTAVDVVVGGRRVAPRDLVDEPGWWFIQDRLVLAGGTVLSPGPHEVDVRFTLMVPYLQGGPGVPLTLPFRVAARLAAGDAVGAAVGAAVGGAATADAVGTRTVARDVA